MINEGAREKTKTTVKMIVGFMLFVNTQGIFYINNINMLYA